MGYYADIEIKTTIKPSCIKQVREDSQFCMDNHPNYLSRSNDKTPVHPKFYVLRERFKEFPESDYLFWHIESMEVEDSGNFSFCDYNQKWYGDVDFMEYLKDKVCAGDIYFSGEDGEKWGYRFDGKGAYKKLAISWRVVG